MALNTVGDAVGLDYWLQWQVLVCALIIIIPLGISLKITIRSSGNVHQQLKSCDLWLPCWKNLHPKWLLLYRVIAFCFMALLLCQTVVSFGPFICFYYTQYEFLQLKLFHVLQVLVFSRIWILDSLVMEMFKNSMFRLIIGLYIAYLVEN